MSNLCSNKLIVVGLESLPPKMFAEWLEQALYGEVLPRGEFYSVVVGRGSNPRFRFETDWQPPEKELIVLSKKCRRLYFLLEYSCWESGFRGQMVIGNGEVIESVYRRGYDGPGFLFADITHPLVQLWGPYMGLQTLAEQALNRVQDAVAIVKGLKQTLEDQRFTDSPYRTCGDESQVVRARASLTAMLEAMIRHASEISFDGVLVSDSTEERYANHVRAEESV
jgi:hypothetical protein